MKLSFFLFIGIFIAAQVKSQTDESVKKQSRSCEAEIDTLISNYERKDRRLLFIPLRHQLSIVYDSVFDESGNLILASKSTAICSYDACNEGKQRMIKIVGDEIWLFKSYRLWDKQIIRRYNACGEFIGRKKWEAGDYFDQ